MRSIIAFPAKFRSLLGKAVPRSAAGIAVTLTILAGSINLALDANLDATVSDLLVTQAHAAEYNEWNVR